MDEAGRAADQGEFRQAAEALEAASNEADRAWWLLIRQLHDDEGLSWPEIGRRLSTPARKRTWQGVYAKYRRFDKRFGRDGRGDPPG